MIVELGKVTEVTEGNLLTTFDPIVGNFKLKM